MIKTRSFPDKNYKAIYFNGKTIRMSVDPSKPIMDLEYPEFYDIKLTNKCDGECPYCYQSSVYDGKDYNALGFLDRFFGSMDDNQKPFQIAYGGGEPTMHKDFAAIMELTRGYGISPNYTTNGMWVWGNDCEAILGATIEYCEGVAITCHDHLYQQWSECADLLLEYDVFLNFHNMIGDKKSVDEFISIYKEWHGKVKYFVVLPIINHGRAKNMEVDYDYFFDRIKGFNDISDIAFGANFYDELKKRKGIKVSLYEPEIMSKYIDLKGGAMYRSSFDCSEPLKYVH